MLREFITNSGRLVPKSIDDENINIPEIDDEDDLTPEEKKDSEPDIN
jgi:hypothetical protein